MDIVLARVDKRTTDLGIPTFQASLTVSCEIREGCSLTAPYFILIQPQGSLIFYNDYNYVYVEKFSRYYFIDEITVQGNRIYIDCTEDYLASFYSTIMVRRFFCTRSYSDYDEKLTDMYFPCKAEVLTKCRAIKAPWNDIPYGQYVIGITSGGNDLPHIGSNCYYLLNDSEITDFMNDLLSKAELTISGIVDSLVKTMVNPLQYIRSCYWFPFTLDCATISSDKISFGWWESNTSCEVIDCYSERQLITTLEVEVPFDEYLVEDCNREYLKYPPYSKYTLTCYPFGVIELSTDIITRYLSGESIIIEITVDHITGMGEFIIKCADAPHLVFTTQVAIEIPVGEILQDYAGVALNTASAIGSAVTGHEAIALSDVYNAIDAVVPAATVQGMAGGFAQLMTYEEWFINRYYHEVTIDSALVGEPCCKSVIVGDLHGYAKFSNVEMGGHMLESEKRSIESLLESGIFIGETY